MNYFPNELEKHYKIEIPLAEYERMKDKITQFEIFKRGNCYFKELYEPYIKQVKYYALSKDSILKEFDEEIKKYSETINEYMIQRNKYHNELKKIKKSLIYKIFKRFIN